MRVFVYRNLHKNCLSVRCVKTKRVIAHVDFILLEDCKFKVSQKGRERVLKEKRKNVHAGVEGDWVEQKKVFLTAGTFRVSYDPYKHETFVDNRNTPRYECKNAIVTTAGVFII